MFYFKRWVSYLYVYMCILCIPGMCRGQMEAEASWNWNNRPLWGMIWGLLKPKSSLRAKSAFSTHISYQSHIVSHLMKELILYIFLIASICTYFIFRFSLNERFKQTCIHIIQIDKNIERYHMQINKWLEV